MKNRIHGLDLARFLAFVGMVIVNFKVALQVDETTVYPILKLLDGKAAATFVILAGIGVSLGAKKLQVLTLLKRALFLFAIGLLNATIFEADILHYYGVYLLIAAFFLTKSNKLLLGATISAVIFSYGYLLLFNYEAGWDWETLTYTDFWTPLGFLRNLFLNGFHPTLPWISFLLLGMWLGRRRISENSFQTKMITIGAITAITTELFSRLLISQLVGTDPELTLEAVNFLFGTGPMPPNPFYMITSSATAIVIIGVCLKLASKFSESKVLYPFLQTGKMALTLYIAHILIGMGILEEMGRFQEPQSIDFVLLSAFIFCFSAVLFSTTWLLKFKRGPIESIMRRISS